MSRQVWWGFEKSVVHPQSSWPWLICPAVTGIDPRHKLHRLSLLPSGPDEVRDRLLRGGRSARQDRLWRNPQEGIRSRIKRISGIGHR